MGRLPHLGINIDNKRLLPPPPPPLPAQVEPRPRVVEATRVVASHVCPVAREVDGAEVVRHERAARAVERVTDPRTAVVELRVPDEDVALLRMELLGLQFMLVELGPDVACVEMRVLR